MTWYRMFFFQTSTLPPSMEHKFIQHGRCCMQHNYPDQKAYWSRGYLYYVLKHRLGLFNQAFHWLLILCSTSVSNPLCHFMKLHYLHFLVCNSSMDTRVISGWAFVMPNWIDLVSIDDRRVTTSVFLGNMLDIKTHVFFNILNFYKTHLFNLTTPTIQVVCWPLDVQMVWWCYTLTCLNQTSMLYPNWEDICIQLRRQQTRSFDNHN